MRRVRPEDAEALADGFTRLSRESRLFRFLHAVERLPEADIRTYTTPDHVLHEALGATVIEDHQEHPAGIAHFFRSQISDTRAEMAIAVIDEYQNRGIGSLLLGHLLKAASQLGIETFDALVHSRNVGMAKLLLGLGAEERRDGDIRVFTIPVHDDPTKYPAGRTADAVRRAFGLVPRPQSD